MRNVGIEPNIPTFILINTFSNTTMGVSCVLKNKNKKKLPAKLLYTNGKYFNKKNENFKMCGNI